LSYNVLVTTTKVNTIIKLVLSTVIVKSTLTCTNCGKTGHSMETCYKRKREVPVVPTTTIKFAKPIARTKPNLLNQERYMFVIPV